MNATDITQIVHHINHKVFDNRKDNLIICIHSQNSADKINKLKTRSGITGVWKNKNRWCAIIGVNQKRIYLGNYKDKNDAIIARLKAEKLYFGEFAPQKNLYKQYEIE